MRGQFEKHFANDDGTMTAIVYPTAVHYEKDGEWVDYDNTLVSTARDGQVVYQNSSNPLQVQFAQEGEQEGLVHLEYDGHEISWSLATAEVEPQQPAALMSANALQPDKLETMSTTAEQSGEGYLISYTPDREWLEDESWVYPVVIDPSVSVSRDTSNIDDTYVHPGDYAGQHYGETSFKVGTYQGTLNRAFLRFLNYPEMLGKGSTITEATLRLDMVSGTNTAHAISICEVFSPWQPGTITWNSHQNMSMNYIGHADPTGTSSYTYWITDLVKRAINGENTGFMFRYLDEGINDWNQLVSGNNTAKPKNRPCISITYTGAEYIHYYTKAKLTGGVRGRKYFLGDIPQMYYGAEIEAALASWEVDGTVSFSRTTVTSQSVMDIYMFNNSGEFANANAWVEYYNTSKQQVPKNTNGDLNQKGDPLYDWYYARITLNQRNIAKLNSKQVKGVISHEMGHVFGLDENGYYPNNSDKTENGASYNIYSVMCQERRGRAVYEAQQCDRNGVRALYGY